jgi:hypothetical protein
MIFLKFSGAARRRLNLSLGERLRLPRYPGVSFAKIDRNAPSNE